MRRFQEDEAVRLFVGSIRAAGVGITLTAASKVISGLAQWDRSVCVCKETRGTEVVERRLMSCHHKRLV